MLSIILASCDDQSTAASTENSSSSVILPVASSSSDVVISSSSSSSSAMEVSSSSGISLSTPGCAVESASGFGTDSYCLVLADGSMTEAKCHSVKVVAPVVTIAYKPDGCENLTGSQYCTFEEGIVYIYKRSISSDCTPYYTHLKETM